MNDFKTYKYSENLEKFLAKRELEKRKKELNNNNQSTNQVSYNKKLSVLKNDQTINEALYGRQKLQDIINSYDINVDPIINNNGEIEPKKEKEFLPSVFNFAERLGASVVDFGSDIVEGATRTVEGIVDYTAGLFGADEDFINEDFTSKIMDNSVDKWAREKSYINKLNTRFQDIVHGVGEGVGNMLPSLTVTFATANPFLGTAMFSAGAGGMSTQEALNEGATRKQAMIYGTVSGITEGLIEWISGGIGGLASKGLTQSLIGRKTMSYISSNALTKISLNAVGEGMEEVASDLITPLYKRAIYDSNAPKATNDELIKSFTIGAFSSILMNVFNRSSQTVAMKRKVYTENGTKITWKEASQLVDIKALQNQQIQSYIEKDYKTVDLLSEIITEKSNKVGQEITAEYQKMKMKQSLVDNTVDNLNKRYGFNYMINWTNNDAINGSIDGNIINISYNAENPFEIVLGHELGHTIKGTSEFNNIKKKAIDEMKFSNTYDEKYNKKFAIYKDYYRRYDVFKNDDDIKNIVEEEIVSDYISNKIFSDYKNIVKLFNEKPRFIQSISNFIKEKIATIKGDSKSIKELNDLNNMFMKALNEIKSNQELNRDSNNSRFSIITNENGEQQVVIDLTSELQKQLDGKNKEERKKIVEQYLKNKFVGKRFAFPSNIIATLSNKDVKKISNDFNITKQRALLQFNELLDVAKFVDSKDVEHKSFNKFYYYEVKFVLNDEIYSATLNIGQVKTNELDKHIYELNNIGINKKIVSNSVLGSQTQAGKKLSSTDSISQEDIVMQEKSLKKAKKSNNNIDLKEKYSLSEFQSKTFDEQIDLYIKGEMPVNEQFFLGETPNILLNSGAKNHKLVMRRDTFNKITGDKNNNHHLPIDIIKKIPIEMNNPLFVIKGSQPNTLVEILSLKDDLGKEILVSLSLNSIENHINVTRITSAYGKDRLNSYLKNQSESNNIIGYANKKKTNDWMIVRGLQLPKIGILLSSTNSLSQNSSKLQENSNKNPKNVEKSSNNELYLLKEDNKKYSLKEFDFKNFDEEELDNFINSLDYDEINELFEINNENDKGLSTKAKQDLDSRKSLLESRNNETKNERRTRIISELYNKNYIKFVSLLQRTMSQQSKEFFKNSKMKDTIRAKGLIPMFHGTPNNDMFYFDSSRIGSNGVQRGSGFYFTSSLDYANKYTSDNGKIIISFLNIEKPLNDTRITLTKEQLSNFIRRIDHTGNDFLSNYGDANSVGYNSVLNKAIDSITKYNTNDADIIEEIYLHSGLEFDDFYKKLKNTLGYDGVISKDRAEGTIAITFNSNQAKNVFNKKPTISEDIRFSLKDNKQYIYASPYYSETLTKENYKALKNVEMKYFENARNIADVLGLEDFECSENIGAYKDKNEISYAFSFKNTSEVKANAFGMLLSDLGHEVQDSVIITNYVDKEDANYIEQRIYFKDRDSIIKALNEIGFNNDGYSINRNDNYVNIIIDPSKIDEYRTMIKELNNKQKGNIYNELSKELYQNSRYCNRKTKRTIYGTWMEGYSRQQFDRTNSSENDNKDTRRHERFYETTIKALNSLKNDINKRPIEEDDNWINEDVVYGNDILNVNSNGIVNNKKYSLKDNRQYVTAAPYYDIEKTFGEKLTESNYEEAVKYANEIYQHNAKKFAKLLGIDIKHYKNAIGGYTFSNGKHINEVSGMFNLGDITANDADLFACLMADLGFENQEASICFNYEGDNSEEANGAEFEVMYKDLNVFKVEELLNDVGIYDYTIFDDRVAINTDFDFMSDEETNSLNEKIFKFTEKLKERGKFNGKRKQKIKSRYLARGTRQKIYRSRFGPYGMGEQNGELRSIIELAYEKCKRFENNEETELDKKPIKYSLKEGKRDFVDRELTPLDWENDEKVIFDRKNIKNKDFFDFVEEAQKEISLNEKRRQEGTSFSKKGNNANNAYSRRWNNGDSINRIRELGERTQEPSSQREQRELADFIKDFHGTKTIFYANRYIELVKPEYMPAYQKNVVEKFKKFGYNAHFFVGEGYKTGVLGWFDGKNIYIGMDKGYSSYAVVNHENFHSMLEKPKTVDRCIELMRRVEAIAKSTGDDYKNIRDTMRTAYKSLPVSPFNFTKNQIGIGMPNTLLEEFCCEFFAGNFNTDNQKLLDLRDEFIANNSEYFFADRIEKRVRRKTERPIDISIKTYKDAPTIEKVKGEKEIVKTTFKENVKDSVLDSKIALTNSLAGVDEALEKMGVKDYRVKTNRALSHVGRSEYMLDKEVVSLKDGRHLSKSYKDIFTAMENKIDKYANKEEYLQYKRKFFDYLLHKHNINRMDIFENISYKSFINNDNVPIEAKKILVNYYEFNPKTPKTITKELIDDIFKNDVNLKNDVINALRINKTIFGKYLYYDSLSKMIKEDISNNFPSLENALQNNSILSEADVLELISQDVSTVDNAKNATKYVKEIIDSLLEISPDDSRSTIEKYDKEFPEFKQMAEDVNNLNKAMLTIANESGLISDEAYNGLSTKYPNYVPTYRDRNVTLTVGGATYISRGMQPSAFIKTAKGSDLVIEPIDVTMAKKIRQLMSSEAQNTLIKELYMANIENHNNGYISIEEEAKKTKVDDYSDVEETEYINPTNKTVSCYVNGKLVKMKVTEDIFKGLYDLSNQNVEYGKSIKNMLSKGMELFKKLTTNYNPFFLVRNFIRDIQDATLYSKFGLGQIIKSLPRVAKMIRPNNEYWKEYCYMGGSHTSIFDKDFGVENFVYKSKGKRMYEKSIGKVITPISMAVEKANYVVEQLPRFTEYVLSRENGLSSEEALSNAMEITVNFQRSGTITRKANKYLFPYLNASVQGFCKAYNTFISSKSLSEWCSLLSRVALIGILPSLLNKIMYDDDDEFEELGTYYKDNFYLIKMNNGKFIKIPKGRILGVFGDTVTRTWEYVGGDSDAFDGFSDTLSTAMSPVNGFRTIFSPIDDVKKNVFWNGNQIETDKYSNIAPNKRYSENTSIISKTIGSMLNYSPIKLDYILDQYTGVIGDIVIPSTSANSRGSLIKFFEKNLVVDSSVNSSYRSKFYKTLDKYNYAKSDGDAISTLQVRYMNKIKNEINEIYTQINSLKDLLKIGTISQKDYDSQSKALQILANNLYKASLENSKRLGDSWKTMELSSESIEEDYIEGIRLVLGADTALKYYYSKVYEKADYLNRYLGINFNDFYLAYFNSKSINALEIDPKQSKPNQVFDYINYNFPKLSRNQKYALLSALGYKSSKSKEVVLSFVNSKNDIKEEDKNYILKLCNAM